MLHLIHQKARMLSDLLITLRPLKATLYVIAAGVLFFGISRLVTPLASSEVAESNAMALLLQRGQSLRANIARIVRPAMEYTKRLAQYPRIVQAILSKDIEQQTGICNESIRMSTEIDALALFDATGQILAINTVYASGAPIARDRIGRILCRDFDNRPIVQQCLRNRVDQDVLEFQTTCDITPALFDSVGLSVAYSVPVVNPHDHQKIGVVSARMRFDRLFDLIKNLSMKADEGSVDFITDTGAYFSEDILAGRRIPPIPSETLQNMLIPLISGDIDHSFVRQNEDFISLFRLKDFTTLNGGGIQVMLTTSEAWVTAGAWQGRVLQASIAFGVGAVLLLLASLVQGASSKRVNEQRVSSARAEARSALAETEALRRTLDEHAIVSVADANGKITAINDAFCRISGYSQEELIGQNHLAFGSNDHSESLRTEICNTVTSGQAWHGEVCNRAKDGSIYWLDSIIAPFYGPDGKIDKYVSIHSDITTRKCAEQALHESEVRFRTIADTIPQLIWTSGPDGEADYYNARWLEYTGLTRAESRNSGWTQVLHPDEAQGVGDAWEQTRRDGTPHTIECRLKRQSDGVYRWFLVRIVAVRDSTGAIIQWIGAYTDIDDQKRAAEMEKARIEAEDASRAKSEFLATMSHELRTPLNGVIGMTELLLGTNLDPQQRRYTWLAKSAGDSLLTVINDILDFSKIEAGKLEIETIDFDLRYALESVTAPLASRAESKGLELIAGIHPQVPLLVRGDSGRLQQILMNLVSNAIKFTEAGEVGIRATLENETDECAVVRFTVNDTGIGIPAERLDRLFQSFSQIDASTTRKFGGTGLGLAICKRLVELMGGEIGVISEKGKGSTFWFTIPLGKQLVDNSPAATVNGNLRSLRVLIVDDNATNREVLHEQLNSWGMAHECAQNGMQALAMLREAAQTGNPYGLAITDMQMPGMNGRELAQTIKTDTRIQDTVLVLLTSTQEERDPMQIRAQGFSGYSVKPVRQSQLLNLITEAVACATVLPQAEKNPGPVKAQSRRISRTAGKRILLAEDNQISQEVASTILRQAGYLCDVVSTGKEAVEAVSHQRYDLVLMDCQMPEMDGFTATGTIRKAEQTGQLAHIYKDNLPIIALTANAIKGDRERCLNAGMDDYLTKPLNPERVLDLIESRLFKAPAVEQTPQVISVAHDPAPQCPFDFDTMLKQWGGDRSFIDKLIPKFQKQARSELQQIEDAISGGEAEKTAQLAHRLKGSASYLGAQGVQRAAAQLETMGRSNDLNDAGPVLEKLRVEVQRCLDFILKNEQAPRESHVGA